LKYRPVLDNFLPPNERRSLIHTAASKSAKLLQNLQISLFNDEVKKEKTLSRFFSVKVDALTSGFRRKPPR
jgi:hypothetical protein